MFATPGVLDSPVRAPKSLRGGSEGGWVRGRLEHPAGHPGEQRQEWHRRELVFLSQIERFFAVGVNMGSVWGQLWDVPAADPLAGQGELR